MNYNEWAAEYLQDAGRVHSVIAKKKARLNDKHLTADARKTLLDTITVYRRIYRELVATARLLRARGEAHEA